MSWAAQTFRELTMVPRVYMLRLSIRVKPIQEEQELRVGFKVLRSGGVYFKNALHPCTQGSLTPFKAETLKLFMPDTIPLREDTEPRGVLATMTH